MCLKWAVGGEITFSSSGDKKILDFNRLRLLNTGDSENSTLAVAEGWCRRIKGVYLNWMGK